MSTPLRSYIGQADPLTRLREHADRLLRIDAMVRRSLPAHLADSCHVANLKQYTLVMHTDSGAVAAKLRQLAPGILRALHTEGLLIAEIKVRVTVADYRPEAPAPVVRHVSAPAFDAMTELASTLPKDSPLRAALGRFVKHSRSG